MKLLKILSVALLLMISAPLTAQESPAYALKNVMIHNSDGSVTDNAAIVWRDGIIEDFGSGISIPFDAYTIEFEEKMHIWPGFIDGFGTWGAPEQPRPERASDPGNPTYERAGIQPDREPSELMNGDDKSFKSLVGGGFTTAALGFNGNMLPGAVEVFTLSTENVDKNLLKEEIAQLAQFQRSRGVFPGTIMGVMARFRQLMYDATALNDHIDYYESNPNMPAPNRDEVLEELFDVMSGETPLFFKADSKEEIEKMLILKDEFNFDVVIVSGKEAYRSAEELRSRNIPVLLSFDIPEMPEWYADQKKAEESDNEDKEDSESDEEEEESITEEEQAYRDRQLEAYKEVVSNAKSLIDAGVKVGFASAGIKLTDLKKNVKTILEESDLSADELIAIMTINTAEILGISEMTGSLEKGKMANFMVADKPILDEKAKIKHVVANGKRHDF